MATVLAQIEASLNSRPLYALNDENGVDALTPGHFLIGRPLISIPTPESDINISTLNKWKVIHKIQRDFWKRWKEEYLHTLQQRNKWKTSQQNLKEGDVVIVKDENTQPAEWPLGRVMECNPGLDGKVRVVALKLQNGVLKRPIHKLCPLVTSSGSNQEKSTDETKARVLTTFRPTKSPKHMTNKNIFYVPVLHNVEK
ncbi:uncharacterized protein LOC118732329 [Rhagoletis pomonella]|uniref:uncharacterized protein LOC118732329 n=1 Tax=Rhagoletis pomonella TaxID=28610 RepID=UPI001783440E|nr:uncharacterized protein LOC118732329 [Rhagoletis pomonella]